MSHRALAAKGLENAVVINDFTLATSYARSNQGGGGSAIYVRSNSTPKLSYKTLVNVVPVGKVFEMCAIEVTSKPSFILAAVYRAPDQATISPFLKKLEDFLYKMTSSHKRVIICGDMNINVGDPRLSSRMDEILAAYGFVIRTREPSRITPTSSSVIDLVMTNWCEIDSVVNVDPGLSDHFGQLMKIPRAISPDQAKFDSPVKGPTPFKRRFHDVATREFTVELAAADWSSVYLATTTDDKYDAFLHIFLLLFEKHFPRKPSSRNTTNNRSSAGWITPGIKAACKRKRELSLQVKTGTTPETLYELNQLKKKIKTEISIAKVNFHSRLIHESGNKAATSWRLVKKLTGTEVKAGDTIVLRAGDADIRDPQAVATLLNDYFCQ